jgi:hypothetical protein
MRRPASWWAAAAGTALGAVLELVVRRDVLASGVLFLTAASCVLGAALFTRQRRERRYRSIPDGPISTLPRRTRRLPRFPRGRPQLRRRAGDTPPSIWSHRLTSSALTDLQLRA